MQVLEIFHTVDEKNQICLKELIELGLFGFNWVVKSSPNAQTIAAINNGDIVGLVEFERRPVELANYMFLIEVAKPYRGGTVAGKLLAYVANDSLSQGFGGFFFFEAKDALLRYYIDRYGAKIARNRTLFFDETASKALISEFLEGDGNGAKI